MKDSQTKEIKLLEKRFTELSRLAYQRDIITYSDFLNLSEQNILHTLPKDTLYSRYVSFGGYELAERQMAAFIPDALYLCYGKKELSPEEIGYPFRAVRVAALNRRFSEELTHRDYLGAILNLGIERAKIGDILPMDGDALVFVHDDMTGFIQEQLVRVRHTSVTVSEVPLGEVRYTPSFEEIKGTVASVRLDSLLPLAFSSSRSRLSGLIEGGKVYVNGRLITSNGYQVRDDDVISVRGMGKFRYKGALSRTKKNRTYVVIHKYV